MTEQSADQGPEMRWSANRKTDVVLQLLRGEPLHEVSRQVGVEAHRLASWRDEFLAAGKVGLKGGRCRPRASSPTGPRRPVAPPRPEPRPAARSQLGNTRRPQPLTAYRVAAGGVRFHQTKCRPLDAGCYGMQPTEGP